MPPPCKFLLFPRGLFFGYCYFVTGWRLLQTLKSRFRKKIDFVFLQPILGAEIEGVKEGGIYRSGV